jgi:cobalt transporter subunit CbtA
MAILRRLVFSALCAGLLSGIFATVAHQIATVPIILQAETYETAAEHVATDAHAHAGAWEPEDGIERTGYTLLADILTGTGFALLLAAGLTLRDADVTWREGLFWGLAGFATFTIAPGIGLPPEIPGTAAAPLFARQLWWVATALSTGCGLALLFFTRRAFLAAAAAVLIVLPHLYGAPRPTEYTSVAPEELARQFVVAVTASNFAFWLILGASTGYFYKRFQPRDARFSRRLGGTASA